MKICLSLPEETPERIAEVYSDTQEKLRLEEGALTWTSKENWKAVAALLR